MILSANCNTLQSLHLGPYYDWYSMKPYLTHVTGKIFQSLTSLTSVSWLHCERIEMNDIISVISKPMIEMMSSSRLTRIPSIIGLPQLIDVINKYHITKDNGIANEGNAILLACCDCCCCCLTIFGVQTSIITYRYASNCGCDKYR
jgi:hypothetical protein